MIEITGLSPLQQDIADRIWSMDTQQQITEFVSTLPRSLKREAGVVIMMIVAAQLDSYMEVSDAVHAYLGSV